MSSGWYKVEFYGKPAEGEEPKVPADWEAVLALGGKLAELFGFEMLDGVTVLKPDEVPA